MARTSAKKVAAVLPPLPGSPDESADRIVYAHDPADEPIDPPPGQIAVDQTTTKHERYIKPLPAAPVTGPAATAPNPDESEDDEDTSPLERLLSQLGSDEQAFAYVYRMKDPPGTKFREPYEGSKNRWEGKIEVDEFRNTPESFDEEIQRQYGGGYYQCVLRVGKQARIKGQWTSVIRDVRDYPGAQNQTVPPVWMPPPVAHVYPSEPATAPVQQTQREAMKETIGMLTDLKKLSGPDTPPIDPVTQINQFSTLINAVKTLLPAAPEPVAVSPWAEVVREFGIGDAVRESAKALPVILGMIAQYQASKAGAAKGSAAPASNGAAAGAPAAPQLEASPGPQTPQQAVQMFFGLIAHDGPLNRHPGIAVQLAEDICTQFPDLKPHILTMLASAEGESDEDTARRMVTQLSTQLRQADGSAVNLLQYPSMVPYMGELRLGILQLFPDEEPGEESAEQVATLPASE